MHLFAAARPGAALVLGHGAGRGVDTADLQAIARELPGSGTTVVLVDQPWVLAGRRVAAPAASLDDAWIQVLAGLRTGDLAGLPLVVGGRSTGARVACRTAAAVEADGALLLAFPLCPPASRKDPDRAAAALAVRRGELALLGDRPVTLVQGERDAFGSGEQVLSELDPAHAELFAVPGADQSLRVRGRGQPEADKVVVGAALRAVERARAVQR